MTDLEGNNNKSIHNAFQPGLGACGASLSSPGRLVLSDLIGAENRQKMNVRPDHVYKSRGQVCSCSEQCAQKRAAQHDRK